MQSQQVAREGNALLKKDLEAQAARHKAASEKMAAHADSLQERCSALEASLRDAAEWASHVEAERDRLLIDTCLVRLDIDEFFLLRLLAQGEGHVEGKELPLV